MGFRLSDLLFECGSLVGFWFNRTACEWIALGWTGGLGR